MKMINKLLIVVIISLSTFKLNCCFCSKNTDTTGGPNPKESNPEKPNPEGKPINFESIKLKCKINGVDMIKDCDDVSIEAATGNWNFTNVVNNASMYGTRVRVFKSPDCYYFLVFKDDIKNGIIDNSILPKIKTLHDNIYILCSYKRNYVVFYGNISKIAVDSTDSDLYIVEFSD